MPPIDDLFTNMSIVTILITCGSLLCTGIVTVGIIVLVFRYAKNMTSGNKAIMEQGISARAKILSVQETGVLLNNMPQVLFQLEVYPSSGIPYQATTKAVISLVKIPQYQPGIEIPVKIHPTDPTKVEIDQARI